MILLTLGILSYPVFISDNEFKRHLEILSQDSSYNVSIDYIQEECDDIEDLITKSRFNWSRDALSFGKNQLSTCKDAVKFAKEFRDLLKATNLTLYVSFGLLGLAFAFTILSLIIQVATWKNYAKRYPKCVVSTKTNYKISLHS